MRVKGRQASVCPALNSPVEFGKGDLGVATLVVHHVRVPVAQVAIDDNSSVLDLGGVDRVILRSDAGVERRSLTSWRPATRQDGPQCLLALSERKSSLQWPSALHVH